MPSPAWLAVMLQVPTVTRVSVLPDTVQTEVVLEAIREQSAAARPNAFIWRSDTGLYSVAKKHFGTWRNAVAAAGLQPAQRRWTKDLVILEIKARQTQGLSLSSGDPARDIRLIAAALRYFGGWCAAKAAAGLKPIDHRPKNQTGNQEKRATACHAKT